MPPGAASGARRAPPPASLQAAVGSEVLEDDRFVLLVRPPVEVQVVPAREARRLGVEAPVLEVERVDDEVVVAVAGTLGLGREEGLESREEPVEVPLLDRRQRVERQRRPRRVDLRDGNRLVDLVELCRSRVAAYFAL